MFFIFIFLHQKQLLHHVCVCGVCGIASSRRVLHLESQSQFGTLFKQDKRNQKWIKSFITLSPCSSPDCQEILFRKIHESQFSDNKNNQNNVISLRHRNYADEGNALPSHQFDVYQKN